MFDRIKFNLLCMKQAYKASVQLSKHMHFSFTLKKYKDLPVFSNKDSRTVVMALTGLAHGAVITQMGDTRGIWLGETDGLSEKGLKAMLAHEYGHHINGDIDYMLRHKFKSFFGFIDRMSMEYAADKYAAEEVGTEAMVECLEWLKTQVPELSKDVDDRINHLQQ